MARSNGELVALGSKHLIGEKSDSILSVRIDRPERRNSLTIEA